MKYEGCTILVHLYIIIGLNNSHGSYSGFNHFDHIKLRLLHCMLGVWRAVSLHKSVLHIDPHAGHGKDICNANQHSCTANHNDPTPLTTSPILNICLV